MNNWIIFNLAIWLICGIVSIFRKSDTILEYAILMTILTGVGYVFYKIKL